MTAFVVVEVGHRREQGADRSVDFSERGKRVRNSAAGAPLASSRCRLRVPPARWNRLSTARLRERVCVRGLRRGVVSGFLPPHAPWPPRRDRSAGARVGVSSVEVLSDFKGSTMRSPERGDQAGSRAPLSAAAGGMRPVSTSMIQSCDTPNDPTRTPYDDCRVPRLDLRSARRGELPHRTRPPIEDEHLQGAAHVAVEGDRLAVGRTTPARWTNRWHRSRTARRAAGPSHPPPSRRSAAVRVASTRTRSAGRRDCRSVTSCRKSAPRSSVVSSKPSLKFTVYRSVPSSVAR